MDYFIISQDKRIPHAIEPIGISKELSKEKNEIPVQFNIKENIRAKYVDFIENPVPLVSNEVKKILSKYDKKIFFKPVVLYDKKKTKQELYWLINPEIIDCLSSNTEFHKNGTLKRLVIDRKKIGNFKIFKIQGIMESLIVIRLDVAESLLRRGFTTIKLKKIEREN